MNKSIFIIITSVLGLAVAVTGYHAYRSNQDKILSAERSAAERADADARRLEAEHKAAAETEARRLAELKARQDAADAEKRLADLRAQQAESEKQRIAAEAALAQMTAERERLEKEKEAAQGEARVQAELREKEAAEAEARRQTALKQLQQAEDEKRAMVDREAARLAALKKQQELEANLKLRSVYERSIYPSDYKRREHYYMNIDLLNAGLVPAAPVPPLFPSQEASHPAKP